MDWFLYDRDCRHERVNTVAGFQGQRFPVDFAISYRIHFLLKTSGRLPLSVNRL